MSEEEIELLERMQRVWNRGEEFDLAEYYHPEIEFLPRRAATEGGYHGFVGIEAFMRDTREVYEDFKLVFEYEDLGAQVLAWGTIHVRARASGLETDIPIAGLFEFTDGKISRWEDFGSREEALEAAGRS